MPAATSQRHFSTAVRSVGGRGVAWWRGGWSGAGPPAEFELEDDDDGEAGSWKRPDRMAPSRLPPEQNSMSIQASCLVGG